MYFRSHRLGFSLIELLVVIAIIGILIAIVFVNFQQSRMNTRDKVRQTTLSDIQLAIEEFKAQRGSYPAPGCGTAGTDWATNDTSFGAAGSVLTVAAGMTLVVCSPQTAFISGVMPDFIKSLPSPVGQKYLYFANADRTAYKLIAFGAIESTANQITGYTDINEFAACPSQCDGRGDENPVLCTASGPEPATYAVYSYGGECF